MERLDKIISNRTGISRKDVKSAISSGRVTVSGKVVRSSDFKVGENEEIIFDGKKISGNANVYLVLNKPKGYVSATEDPEQKTVLELVPPELFRNGMFPAGRLDKNTTGLMIITDDGDLPTGFFPRKNMYRKFIWRRSTEESPMRSSKRSVPVSMFTTNTPPCRPS